MDAAEAIEQASALADRGDREGGKALLYATVAKLGASLSSRSPTSRGLQADLERLALDYEDARTYHTSGSKRSKASSLSHRQQRTPSIMSPSALAPSDLVYKGGRAGKASMAQTWSS